MLSASVRRGGSLLSRPAMLAAASSSSLDYAAPLVATGTSAAAAGAFPASSSACLFSFASAGHHQTFRAPSFHSSARSDAGGAYYGSGGSSPSSAFTQGRPSSFVNYGFR